MNDQAAKASNERGAWTCSACGFRGFWSGGPHECEASLSAVFGLTPYPDRPTWPQRLANLDRAIAQRRGSR